MKRIIKLSWVLAAVSLLGACSGEWLNRYPENAVPTEKAILTYDDAVTAMNGLYDGLQRPTYYGANMIIAGEVRGDYMQAVSSDKRSASYYEMQYNSQTAPEMWSAPYNQIRRASNLIQAVEEGRAAEGGTQDKVNCLHGQALALRALAHFDLVRMYGSPYTKDNGVSLGVPVVTVPLKPNEMPGRETVAAVYTQILKDLGSAKTLLATATEKTPSNGTLNVWGVKALLSRVYLYMGKNTEALAEAKDVIENSPYELETNAKYVASWADGGNAANPEKIFQVIQTPTDNADRESISYLMAESGYADIVLSKKWDDMMNLPENVGDVRNGLTAASTVETHKTKFGTSKVWLTKFPGTGANAIINNVSILRLSEVYLNAAEAAFKSSDLPAAKSYLKPIAARNPALDLDVIPVTLDLILQQRAIELVGEGHRFFDLMRNGLKSDRTNRWSYVMVVRESIDYDNSYFRAILPIPVKEIDVNETLREQQNPKY